MSNRFSLLLSFVIFGHIILVGQTKINGFIFETGNRGYINQGVVTLSNEAETEYYGQMTTDQTGAYEFTVSGPGTYLLSVSKKPYFDHREVIVIDESHGKSLYLKHALKRNPGYIFEITIAEKDPIPDSSNDALKGALVEVYNNTKREEVLVIEDLQSPEFKVDLLKGNHYTLLIRKDGFLSKRMEAFVDVEGCILCFEGIGNVTPGVSDNLTEENSMGVLLANVEMDKYYAGKVIGLNDIYYDFGKSNITKEAAKELSKVAAFLKDNPGLKVELGSHTDSRGGAKANMSLSDRRARSAVAYLVNKGGISKDKISAKGYGETNLTNHCSDGVKCSDDEHRLNRRTALKVLDVINEGMQRRLRQMKAEEYMEEILADIDNAGEIRVKEGQTIDEALAENNNVKSTFISEPSDLSTTTMMTTQEVEPAVEMEMEKTEEKVLQKVTIEEAPTIEQAQEVLVDDFDVEDITPSEQVEISHPELTSPTMDKVLDPATDEVEETTAAKTEITTPVIVTKEEVVSDLIPVAVDISNKVDMAVGEGDIIAEIPAPKSLPSPTNEPVIVEETIIETTTAPASTSVKEVLENENTEVEEWIRPGASTYGKEEAQNKVIEKVKDHDNPSYSGYKIVILFSRFELPKGHKIFSKYADIDIYTTADSNKLYMIGKFETKKAAYEHMNAKLKNAYPHSYVVGFDNGIRVY